MKNAFLGICLVLSFLCASQAYKWKLVADERGWKAEQAYERIDALSKELADAHTKDKALAAYTYLSQTVVSANGKNLSRADLLDMLLAQALKPKQ